MENSVWEIQWRSPKLGYYWMHNFVYEVYKKEKLVSYYGIQEENICVDCNNDFNFYVHKESIEKMKDAVVNFYNNKEKYSLWKSNVENLYSHIEAMSWKIKKNISIDDQISYIETLESLFHESVGLHFVTQPHLIQFLHKELEISENKLEKISILMKLPKVLVEQKEWIALLKNSNSNSFSNSYIKEHLEKWKYITAGDSQRPMTEKFLAKRWENDITVIEELEENFSQTYLNKSDDYFEASIKDKHIISILREISYIRFQTKEMWMKIWFLLEEQLKNLQNDLKIKDILTYTLEEIKNNSFDEEKRIGYIFLKMKDDYWLYCHGLEKKKRNELFILTDYKNINSVSGDTGYPGKVKGIIVKIDWGDEIEEKIAMVNERTIIVVPQTTPNIVGAITKCLGIICDEGGITGHASIISRELKKTCLLGTDYATKIFSDNEEVVIDTYNKIAYKIV